MPQALIVGATSTVAQDVARLLARRGYRFLLVGRNPGKLAGLRAELGDAVLFSASCDFNDAARTTDVLRRACTSYGRIDTVIVAHGYLGDQARSETEVDEARLQIETNFTSVVTQLVIITGYLELWGKGTVLVLSSVAGDRGRPRNYTYGAAKGALNLYLQGLRSRLWPRIRVITVKLGPVVTPMSAHHEKNATFISSEQAARGIVRALGAARGEVYVPRFYGAIMFWVRVLPEALFQRLKFLSGR